jgi:inorganic pyrophosphatase
MSKFQLYCSCITCKLHISAQNISSHFNSKHISGGICEKCKVNKAVDVHHLIFQNEANDKGIINKKGLSFNKDNAANLINLCEKCHNEIHKTNKRYKKTKTTKRTILEDITDFNV